MKKSLYIQLLKKTLTDFHRLEYGEYKPLYSSKKSSLKLRILKVLDNYLKKSGYRIHKVVRSSKAYRNIGKDWPAYAETMIGIKRLDNIEYCVREILKDNIPGDFIETGVWRGGATILMKALLKEANNKDRVVWVADSFEGLPRPNPKKYIADKGDKHFKYEELAIPLEVVQKNFHKYRLLDENVKFLKGWFKDTLPGAPIEKLALIRLDGDIYESTMDGLVNLYPKLSPGGFIIIDDWGAVKGCQEAVIEYRKTNNIVEEIHEIDWTGAYWRKGS